jgi:hypothetical protein
MAVNGDVGDVDDDDDDEDKKSHDGDVAIGMA